MCDEIIDADVDAKANDEAKPKNEETETIFNEKKQPVKDKISIFCFHLF